MEYRGACCVWSHADERAEQHSGFRAVKQATVIYGLLEPFRSYLEGRGVAAQPIFEEAGLPFQCGIAPEARVSLDAAARALNIASGQTGDRAIGIDYATSFPAGASGMIGHLMLSAPTVREMLSWGIQFVELAMSPVDAIFTEEYGQAVYGIDFLERGDAPLVQFGDFVLALMVMRLRRAAGDTWTPSRTSLAHRPPKGAALSKYRETFGSDIEFDAPRYEFAVPCAVLDMRNPVLLPGLEKTILRVAERELEEARRQDDLVETVRRKVVEMLRDERAVQLDAVAKALGTTSRTLQWRLRAAGTTFEDVFGMLREQLAIELLRDSELPIAMISNRLGFSEPSGFARWSRRRFNKSPSEVREHVRRLADL
ncbi:MAG: AraC family transcriptional regulator ligand-binding domain-containing protein [Gammaproteobacteria bacterium]